MSHKVNAGQTLQELKQSFIEKVAPHFRRVYSIAPKDLEIISALRCLEISNVLTFLKSMKDHVVFHVPDFAESMGLTQLESD